MKPKLLFVYDMPLEKEKMWMDGLWAALNVLQEDFEIDKENLQIEHSKISDPMYNFILGWGGFNSSVDKELHKPFYRLIKKGLCIAGNAFPPTGANNYDVLFYETKWYRPQINFHKNIVQAFGVNTDIYFKPDISMPIIWDYIGVGAFASWKRWEKMKDKKGHRMVIGEYQTGNEQESLSIVRDLITNGVMVSPMVHPFDLSNFYWWSRALYLPSDINGGGERAVMEAKACGLRIEIEDDNPKLKELVESPVLSHFDYAKKLKEGILSIIK